MNKGSTQRKAAQAPAASSTPPDERAQRIEEVIGPGPQTGTKYLPEGFRRKNILMHKDHLYKLKCLSYWENASEYEIMYLVWEEYLKNRKIKDIPPRRSVFPRK